MRLYYEIARTTFRRSMTYKLANVTGIVVNSFFGYIHSYIFVAVYSVVMSSQVAGFSLHQAISYAWFSQALIMVSQVWIDKEQSKTIVSGDAVSDISKPFDYQAFWLSRFAGNSVYAIIFRAIPIYAVGYLLFHIYLPHDLAVLPLFLISMILSIVVSFMLGYLFNLTTFWTLNPNGILTIGATVQMFFSGFIVPIAYMPDWAAWLSNVLPFQAVVSIPAQVWLGQRKDWTVLLPQVFWLIVLWLAGRLVTRIALRKVTIQGG